MLNAAAGIDITHVPYKGTAPALNDLLGRQIPSIWATPNVVIQYVETGKVKPLAVAALERVAILPNVPTVNESAVAGFDVSVFFGIAAPSKTPRDIVERLSREIAEVDKMADMRAKMAPLGYDIAYADSLPLRRQDRQRSRRPLRQGHPRGGKSRRIEGVQNRGVNAGVRDGSRVAQFFPDTVTPKSQPASSAARYNSGRMALKLRGAQ